MKVQECVVTLTVNH